MKEIAINPVCPCVNPAVFITVHSHLIQSEIRSKRYVLCKIDKVCTHLYNLLLTDKGHTENATYVEIDRRGKERGGGCANSSKQNVYSRRYTRCTCLVRRCFFSPFPYPPIVAVVVVSAMAEGAEDELNVPSPPPEEYGWPPGACTRCFAKVSPPPEVTKLDSLSFTPGGIEELRDRLQMFALLPREVNTCCAELSASHLAFFAGGRHSDGTHNRGAIAIHSLQSTFCSEGTSHQHKLRRSFTKRKYADLAHDVVSSFSQIFDSDWN